MVEDPAGAAASVEAITSVVRAVRNDTPLGSPLTAQATQQHQAARPDQTVRSTPVTHRPPAHHPSPAGAAHVRDIRTPRLTPRRQRSAAPHDPHQAAPHARAARGPAQPRRRGRPAPPWTVLAVALAAQILVVLDISVVNTALPTIGRDLNIDGGNLQWLVTAYVMMSGGGLLLGGRISDLLSRRGVFLTGLALFTAASIVSGFAGSTGELVAARAVQGLSAALLTPSALSLITTTYAGAQRRTALALWGAVGSLGVAAGVLLGGAVTTWTSWQFIFWINGPIGALALLVGSRTIAKEQVARPRLTDLDLPGATAVIGGLVALTYALGATATHGWWSAHTVVAMAVSAVLLIAFLTVERRAAKPLFPPHVWKLDALVSGTAVMLGITGLLVGAVFLTSIFVQTVLGYSALETGVAFLPFAFAITAGTVVARHLLAHLAPRVVAATGLVGDRRRRRAAVDGRQPTPRYAADLLPGLVDHGRRRRHGLRPGVGDVDGRHPRLARRRGLRLPDDRPRGRRRARCRRPLRGGQHRRVARHARREPPPRSAAASPAPPSSQWSSPRTPCGGCPPSASPAPSATCTTDRVDLDPPTTAQAVRTMDSSLRTGGTVTATTDEQRRHPLALALLVSAQFLVMLDTSIVNVALPSIQTELGFGPAAVTWVVNAYVLAFAGLLLLSGRASRPLRTPSPLHHRRRPLHPRDPLAALATGPVTLIGGRVVQGVGAAALSPAAMSLLLATFPAAAARPGDGRLGRRVDARRGDRRGHRRHPRRQRRLAGGVPRDRPLLRRLPSCSPGACSHRTRPPARRSPRLGRRGRWPPEPSSRSSTAPSTPVDHAWTSPRVLGLLAASVVARGRVRRRRTTGRDPLVPLELFALAARLRRGVVLALLGGSTRGSTFVLIALYFQQVLAMSPQQAGLAMVPTSLTGFAVSLGVLPRALKALGPLGTLVLGLVLLAGGQLWLGLRTPRLRLRRSRSCPACSSSRPEWRSASPPPPWSLASTVPASHTGLASGLASASMQVGGALGTAAFIVIGASAGRPDHGRPHRFRVHRSVHGSRRRRARHRCLRVAHDQGRPHRHPPREGGPVMRV